MTEGEKPEARKPVKIVSHWFEPSPRGDRCLYVIEELKLVCGRPKADHVKVRDN